MRSRTNSKSLQSFCERCVGRCTVKRSAFSQTLNRYEIRERSSNMIRGNEELEILEAPLASGSIFQEPPSS